MQRLSDPFRGEFVIKSALSRCFQSLALLAATLTLAGCTSYGGGTIHRFGLPNENEAALEPALNYNLITVRRAPSDMVAGVADKTRTGEVFCVSPSPDWAVALARQASATGSGSVPSGPSVSLSGSYSSSETISAALGRTAGVVALRDGLYQACQAYANGQIGRIAYALILSQYGNVLANVIGSSSTTAASSTASTPTTTAPTAVVGVSVTPAAATSATTPAAAAASSPVASTPSPAAGPIAIMQQEHIQALVVACLNEHDPSLAGYTKIAEIDAKNSNSRAVLRPQDNDIAASIHEPLLNIEFCAALLDSVKSGVKDLLKPVIVATPAVAATNDKSASGSPAACPDTRPVKGILVAEYQGALKTLGFLTGAPSGKLDRATTVALTLYQKANALCVSGYPDKATLSSMKLLNGV